eukprot:CAMPEP_0197349640 /NCGR_PEP_ID=MMETSP0893-20130614/10889_1 /TAXON_ID=44058 ORGANISM="Aureoumbra lagunensis, Strain CCMP1510" /NCGR_SAMPLE_ID=MMETSP0893 /ASSEMBLY_ACC=CAM_ASM_000539 /LENGTH=252 /DNA_ID=CAMNT_0042861093 /DNA_START=50 /DNA_END=808 /DNA_ORIENTATION=+
MTKTILALALLCPVSAFIHQQPAAGAPNTVVNGAKDDLIAYAEANPTPLSGFWDPLGLADLKFWTLTKDESIGFLRHAEIKHGRVAMAAFLGFCVQSTPLVSGEHTLPPYKGYVAGLTPQEQFFNMPLYAKLQIFTLIGMLESYGEGAGMKDFVHYTKGGKPGYYPPIKGKGLGQIQFNLYDPFDWLPEQTAAEKEKGLLIELNNGRLAQLGIFSLLSESAYPGAIPGLRAAFPDFPTWTGNVMAPFAGQSF